MPRTSPTTRQTSTTICWTNSVETSTETVRGIAVVTLSGDLSATALVPCRRALDTALRRRPDAVVLDLHGLGDARSVVPVLGLLRRYAARRGAAFYLMAPSPAVTRALAAAGVTDMYTVVPSLVEAVQMLSSRACTRSHVPAPDRRPLVAAH